MSEQQPILPAEVWYKSEVQIRAVIALGAQLLSIVLRIVGRYTELSITTNDIDQFFADITQGAAILFAFLAVTKRGTTSVAPLAFTTKKADAMNISNPPMMEKDPTKLENQP